MIVQICIGSSCYLKGSEKIVAMFQKAVEEYGLTNEVTLAGSFCFGKCNRDGVTIGVDDDVYTGVTPETFPAFFKENILNKPQNGGD